MLLKKTCYIGLHVVLLLHLGQSLVLLTANIEDVKKLARKFVSESLADKVAEFIARATQQIVQNVSEENDMNFNEFPYASDMDNTKQSNAARQRDENENRNKKGLNTKEVREKNYKPGKQQRKITKSKYGRDESHKVTVNREQNKDSYENRNPNPIKSTQSARQYAYLIKEHNKQERKKKGYRGNKKYKPKKASALQDSMESTTGEEEKYIDIVLKNPQSGHRYFTDEEHNNTIDINDNVKPKTSDISDATSESNEQITHTSITDLKDTSIPKGKFLATSGLVLLPKIDESIPGGRF